MLHIAFVALKVVGVIVLSLVALLAAFILVQEILSPRVHQRDVLDVLAKNGALTSFRVAERLGIKPSSAGSPKVLMTLWSLAEDGLVKRSLLDTTPENMRAKIGVHLTHWVITEEGRASLRATEQS
jgi:hypothetical protein